MGEQGRGHVVTIHDDVGAARDRRGDPRHDGQPLTPHPHRRRPPEAVLGCGGTEHGGTAGESRQVPREQGLVGETAVRRRVDRGDSRRLDPCPATVRGLHPDGHDHVGLG